MTLRKTGLALMLCTLAGAAAAAVLAIPSDGETATTQTRRDGALAWCRAEHNSQAVPDVCALLRAVR